jgi:endonuclease/exonuclease/phosphatase family metal-dependent hydrolase
MARFLQAGNIVSFPLTLALLLDLNLLTWNIERGEQFPAVAEAVRQLKPQVALLQEVDRNARRSGFRDVGAELARPLRLNHVWSEEFQELGQGRHGAPAWQGQALLSSLPIVSMRVLRFSRQTDYWQPRWYLPNWAIFQRREGGRIAQVVELRAGTQRLAVYNVHLESHGSEELRLGQIQELIADARRYPDDTPIVVGGDLNVRVPSPPAIAALLGAGFRTAAGGEITTTHGTALDWILVRGPVQAADAVIHRDVRASDHFPVTVRIRLVNP